MALSNIRREPRREITETVVGLVVVVFVVLVGLGVLWPDYYLGVWIHSITVGQECAERMLRIGLSDSYCGIPWEIGMLAPLGLVAIGIVLGLLLVGIHATGEGVCGILDKRGIHLRPRQRY